MDDVVGGGGWTIDPAARHAMLLEAARDAVAAGSFAEAVMLAEELLDADPDDVEALLLVAETAPLAGHGEVGALAARQAAARGAEVGPLEVAALLAACDVAGALEAADRAIGRTPGDARLHLHRAEALELLRRPDEAAVARRRAAELGEGAEDDVAISDDEWEALVLAATSRLERSLRDALRAVEIVVRDLPDLSLLRAIQPPPDPRVGALVLDPDARRPRLELYRSNLRRGATSLDDVAERLAHALGAEAEFLLEDRE